ncbi:MAG: TonB-dependent receptor [Planctomycetota bacterium]|nr:TonB-dependent receptor [Planctomycetota bacterium]
MKAPDVHWSLAWGLTLLACVTTPHSARAESESINSRSVPVVNLAPDPNGTEPTLPPVVVSPPESAGEIKPSDEPSVVDAGGSGERSSVPNGSNDRPSSSSPSPRRPPQRNSPYLPSLTEQQFGDGGIDVEGLQSAIRGSSSLFDSPSFGTIVDRPTLDQRMPADMVRTIQNEVGVLMQQTARGQASPFLRGVTGEQVLVLVDGVRQNNAILRGGPNQYFNTVDPGQVERIEIVRGSQSVLWGSDAIGGVINIITRGADPFRGDYTGGSYTQYFSTADTASYSRANVEGWVQDHGVFAGGSYLNVNDLDRGGGLGRQPFTNYDQYSGDVKYNFVVSDTQLLTVAYSHFVQRDVPRSDRFPPFVFGPPSNSPRPTFFNPQQKDFAYLRWQGFAATENPFCDAFSLTTSYALTREGTTELRSPTQLEDGLFRDDTWGYQLAATRDFDWAGKVTYGADYYRDDIDARKFRVNPQDPNQSPSVRTPQYPDDAVADRAGAFLYWDVLVAPRLHTTTGVRYENANVQATPEFTINNVAQDIFFERTYQDWVTSVGLVYELTERLNLIGGIYEGYRTPTVDDLTANKTFLQNAQSNPSLGSLQVQPEHSWTYEVGFKFNGSRWHYQVDQWWMQLDDYIARSIDGVGNQFLDNHDAYLYGTEFAGDCRLQDGWSLYGNYWYTYGRDRSLNEPFSRIPPMQGVLGLRWQDDLRTRYLDIYTWLVDRQDRYSSVNLSDSRFPVGGTPGYGTLNLRLGRSFGDSNRHRVSLALENITDKYYRVLGSGVDGPGFNALLGYQVHW